jgi:hypothetical protein
MESFSTTMPYLSLMTRRRVVDIEIQMIRQGLWVVNIDKGNDIDIYAFSSKQEASDFIMTNQDLEEYWDRFLAQLN